MDDIRSLWRRARAVCFDVDSTATQDEAIDVLAAFKGVGDQVKELTASAMSGAVPFEDALERRLALINPSRVDIDTCLQRHPPRLTPGMRELVAALRARAVAVHLITGGFRQMVAPVARELGIRDDRIIANILLFDADGAYQGFDLRCPTARSGGKAIAMGELKQRHGYAPLIMVGDGVTDLEARPACDGFIGFGGVVVREKVKAGADWYVTDFRELIEALGG